jgi:molecular chaperone DnaK (HSP70)
MDHSGILKCSAKDEASGSSAGITIKNSADRLTKDQIENMIQEAKKFEQATKTKQKASRCCSHPGRNATCGWFLSLLCTAG